ncbi:hypothetical protein ACKWTF_002438 [Chironomus riparius]
MPPKYEHPPQEPLPKRKKPEMARDEKDQKEVSNLELFQLIEKMRVENNQGMVSLNNDLGSKITGIQTSLTAIQDRVEEMDVKIQESNTKADESLKLAYQNKAAINMLYQSKLKNKIEIVGARLDSTLKGNELTLKVKQLIESFNIALSNQDIAQAYQRICKKSEAFVVVVEFSDFDTKMNVLKAKKNSKCNSKIFFNDCLTPLNRYLMFEAKKVAKEKNFRVFMSGDQIHIKKDKDTKKAINDTNDLEAIKNWTPNQPKPATAPEDVSEDVSEDVPENITENNPSTSQPQA